MSEAVCGISFLVHGPSKSGKTWLGESSPAPRLILDAEGGTRFLQTKKIVWDPRQAPPEADGSWETCLVYVRDYSVLASVYAWLQSGKHPFRSVVLDSISEVQQRCIDAIAGDEQMKMQQWGELARKVSALVRAYRDLLVHPTNPLRAVVLIAMTKEVNGKQTPYVQGQLATTLPFFIDCVFYMKAQMDESGNFINYVLTKPHDMYDCGDRTGVFPAIVQNPRIDQMVEMVCNPGGIS